MFNPAVGYMICYNAIEQNKRNRENVLKSNTKTVHSCSVNNSNSNVNVSGKSTTGSTITEQDIKLYWQQIEMTKNLLKILNPDLDIS